uniref:DNA primase n=1 Tax=Candidatus Onthocola sp. TaxID=3085646 RepID=UPI003FEDFD6D
MAYISNEEINEIRSRANIVDIISGYLQVSSKGKNYVALCPFHNDHSPSLIISPEKQIFNCFTCRTGGNVFSFVMKYENVSFAEAVSIVAKKVGFNLKNDVFVKSENKYSKDYEIYEYAMKYYLNNINTTDGSKARDYLLKRGINETIIKEFKLGYSGSSKDTFYKLATNKGWDIETLNKLGLINKVNENVYDTFINRVVIPIENLKGEVVGFTGRIFNGEDNTAKYLNTKETEIFKKSSLLFNYHNAKNYIRDRKSVIVVEGNMDAIKMSAKGFKNVVALMGVALSNEQIDILKRLKVPVILMLDNDNAGEDATIKNGESLINSGVDTKVVRLSGAKDPDEYLEKFGIDAMQNNIDKAIKYIDFKIECLKKDKDLSNMEDLITYVKEVINSINGEDDLTKEIILSKISKDYAIDIDILKSNLKTEVKKDAKKEETQEVRDKKLTKYQKASHKVLYYMLMDSKYINLYKNTLGYFKERIERVLASEIVYYESNNGNIDVADFTTTIMGSEDEYEFLQIILSENGNTSVSDEEFNSCVKAILDIYKKDEIIKVKGLIASELDQTKKEELVKKLIDLKRKCE